VCLEPYWKDYAESTHRRGGRAEHVRSSIVALRITISRTECSKNIQSSLTPDQAPRTFWKSDKSFHEGYEYHMLSVGGSTGYTR
jgi:hypothetical protein